VALADGRIAARLIDRHEQRSFGTVVWTTLTGQ
jgi:hypothetical protein